MVKITGFKSQKNSDGQPFIVLEIQGCEPEIVKSKESGNFYLTVRKTSIASTLSEEEAILMVGKQLPGQIKKIEVEPYQIEDEKSDDVITVHHRHQYVPEWIFRCK